MENLIKTKVAGAPYYPEVSLDYITGVLEINGESYMEDTYKFYEPIINWLNSYIAEKKSIQFDFKLFYFNTSTSRFILDILEILKNYLDTGGNVVVRWHYSEDDPDMVDDVNDFMEEIKITIELIKTKK